MNGIVSHRVWKADVETVSESVVPYPAVVLHAKRGLDEVNQVCSATGKRTKNACCATNSHTGCQMQIVMLQKEMESRRFVSMMQRTSERKYMVNKVAV